MYSNRMLRHTNCRARNAFDVESAMRAAFGCPATQASPVVAQAALRRRWRSTKAGFVDEETERGSWEPYQTGSRRWRACEDQARSGAKEQEDGEHRAEEALAAAGKLRQYEMLLHGSGPETRERPLTIRKQSRTSRQQPSSFEDQPRIHREQSRSRGKAQQQHARRGATRIVAQSDESAKRMIAEGKNTFSGWTRHMQVLSQKLRDPETRKSMTQEEFDYVGLPIEPQPPSMDAQLPIPWALAMEDRKDLTASQLLDEEVRRFMLHMQPSTKERNTRFRVAEHAHSRVRAIFGEKTDVAFFGSTQTKTDMPISDIDIFVNTKGASAHDHESDLHKLFQELDNSRHYFCVVFRGGQFPILTAQHAQSGLDVQVVASVDTRHTHEVIALLDETPHLRPLYFVVRMMLGIRGFVNPFIGGISAYGTMMMMAASIKLREISEPASTSESAGSQLLHYLDFFANFDTTENALSVKPPQIVPKHTETLEASSYYRLKGRFRRSRQTFRSELHRLARTRPQQPYLLVLQDPTNPINDLGGRCHAIKHILRTIQHLNTELRSSMLRYDEAREQGKPLEGEFSLLLPLVGRCHELYAERRAKLVEFCHDRVRERGRAPRGNKRPTEASKEAAELSDREGS